MNLSRIRKALVAAGSAALAVAGTQLAKDGVPANPDGWAGLIVAMLGAAVVAGFATYSVRNAGTVNGSDPAPGTYVSKQV